MRWQEVSLCELSDVFCIGVVKVGGEVCAIHLI